jgi:hypothetical protein
MRYWLVHQRCVKCIDIRVLRRMKPFLTQQAAVTVSLNVCQFYFTASNRSMSERKHISDVLLDILFTASYSVTYGLVTQGVLRKAM